MDLSERARIKQDFARKTNGCKTANKQSKYLIHFMGLINEHNDQVWLEKTGDIWIIHCSTDGYNGTNGGRFQAGATDYKLPETFSLTYENLIEYIKCNTWVEFAWNKEDIISKEKFAKEILKIAESEGKYITFP